MNERSHNALIGCNSVLVDKATRMCDLFEEKTGREVTITSGLRTWAEQHALFLKGPSVTKADAGHSSHNYGMAFDCVPDASAAPGLQPEYQALDKQKNLTPDWKLLVEIAKGVGLKWGGDWKTMKGDYGHFYIGPDSPNAHMRTLYAQGALPAVWKEFESV